VRVGLWVPKPWTKTWRAWDNFGAADSEKNAIPLSRGEILVSSPAVMGAW
jgi:hypothetical protein